MVLIIVLFSSFTIQAQTDSIAPNAYEDTTQVLICPRGTPEPILKKEAFPEAKFRLVDESQDKIRSKIGIETAVLKNGDQLKIINSGCEYYTLEFEVTTERFPHKKTDDLQFWYSEGVKTLKSLANQTKMTQFIKTGQKAMKLYVEKQAKLQNSLKIHYDIHYGNPQNYNRFVKLNEIEKTKTGTSYKILISMGPL